MTNTLIKILNIACHIDCPHEEDLGEQNKVKKGSYQALQ